MSSTDPTQLVAVVREGATVLEPDTPTRPPAPQGTQDRLFTPTTTMPGQLVIPDA